MPTKRAPDVNGLIPRERIEPNILLIRGQKVMLSAHLAELYGVPARRLNQAVRRNIDRFPLDFMFQLSADENRNLKSQFVTSSWGGSRRARPYAFSEQGIAMLSAVLRSPTAVAVSIEIMRAFVRLRQLLASHEEFRQRLHLLEEQMAETSEQFAAVFDAIRELMDEKESPRPKIGFVMEPQDR